ncbi:hypothetical protein POTOM_016393 [Populus tomentosa]|uniref:Uncharacterized protein n=1 Tax=Populus tomentosa TaxID=118781 RepID=A0A8X8A1J7_POPTO|nr:hypothetical protein POTOM_016393 [Populus tomentosa]
MDMANQHIESYVMQTSSYIKGGTRSGNSVTTKPFSAGNRDGKHDSYLQKSFNCSYYDGDTQMVDNCYYLNDFPVGHKLHGKNVKLKNKRPIAYTVEKDIILVCCRKEIKKKEELNFAIRYRRIGTLRKRIKRTGHCRVPSKETEVEVESQIHTTTDLPKFLFVFLKQAMALVFSKFLTADDIERGLCIPGCSLGPLPFEEGQSMNMHVHDAATFFSLSELITITSPVLRPFLLTNENQSPERAGFELLPGDTLQRKVHTCPSSSLNFKLASWSLGKSFRQSSGSDSLL